MTFEEAKDLLMDMRAAKRRAGAIKARLNELESDYSALIPLTAKYGAQSGNSHSSGNSLSTVAIAVERLETERIKFSTALEKVFRMEDELTAAINTLPPIEQDIIIGYYLDGKEHWKLANECGYSIETIKRKKNGGIRKISERLQVDPP